jgi:hypothetical protein
MKALSVRQPWAWLICKGYKDIENRNWPTQFRGRIYVHAGMTLDISVPASSLNESWILERLAPAQREEYYASIKHRGAIIGEVDIIDCVDRHSSPWFDGKYGFILTNPVLYENPIPCRGKLGIFEQEIIIDNKRQLP